MSKYQVIGNERVVYKSTVWANSPEEAKQRFLGLLKAGNHRDYAMLVSGIEIEVEPTEEEA